MKLKFIGTLAVVALASTFAFSQANSSAALPSAPGAANDPPPPALNFNAKIAAINEGQRDLEALGKKFEPKRSELNNRKSEIDALKKQQTAAGVTDEKKTDLQRQIDSKQKQLERDAQDAQEDFNTQQQEIGQRIFQKMGPVIMKYAQENGLGMIVDTSTPWPNGPVLYYAPLDITKAIVDAYNTQSGVAAPANGGATKPAIPRTAPATKPATPPAK
jgi:Skp family chaperone for outer membrane proteins